MIVSRIDHPSFSDKQALDALLKSDYKTRGIEKPSLTEAQMRRYAEKAWVAYNMQYQPEAIVLGGDWKYGDAALYSQLSIKILKSLSKFGGLYKNDTGIFVMSATDYGEGGPLAQLTEDTRVRVLEPSAGSVHVPLLENEYGAYNFLTNRGFKQSAEGLVPLFGIKTAGIDDQEDALFRTVLMTKKSTQTKIID